jgi:hypothetical protein
MHKIATKYNKTLSKWCKNKHGASKIVDTFETYHLLLALEHLATASTNKRPIDLIDRVPAPGECGCGVPRSWAGRGACGWPSRPAHVPPAPLFFLCLFPFASLVVYLDGLQN